MKPHLNLRHGVWACFTWTPRVMGCGHTAREAFRDWKGQLSSPAEAFTA
jgi:hypothetical protein